MRYIEKTKLIERIDQLVRLKATGSARELAKRVGVSKSTLYEILEIMRMMGAEIEYSQTRKSFFYTTEKVLAIGYVDQPRIRGGKNFQIDFQCPDFSDNYFVSLFKKLI